MFDVRFIRNDNKPDEIYSYSSLEDATKHFEMFLNDDSCLYKNISVMDVKEQTVLLFANYNNDGTTNKVLSNGCFVKLAAKWCRAGEEKYRYKVSNIHEEQETCLITCINSGRAIGSSEAVGVEMIDLV